MRGQSRFSTLRPKIRQETHLDIVDGVRRLNLEGDGLAREGLDENLHTAAQTEDQVERGFLLDVVV